MTGDWSLAVVACVAIVAVVALCGFALWVQFKDYDYDEDDEP